MTNSVSCQYFGVRTIEREKNRGCQVCKEHNPEVFKECTIATNTLSGTSIDVDEEGNTIRILPERVIDNALMLEESDELIKTRIKEESGLGQVEKDTARKYPEKRREVTNRVCGLVKLCRELKLSGKTTEEIEQEVAKRYVEAGKSERDAKSKARSFVKNMVWERV